MKCTRCDGCGRIANSEDGEPWATWENLRPVSQAVESGLVSPIECPDYGGSGEVPHETARVWFSWDAFRSQGGVVILLALIVLGLAYQLGRCAGMLDMIWTP